MATKRQFLKMTAAAAIAAGLQPWLRLDSSLGAPEIQLPTWGASAAEASAQVVQTPLDAHSIAKFVEPLPIFGPPPPGGLAPGQVNAPRVSGLNIKVSAQEIQQQILPSSFYAGLPSTVEIATGLTINPRLGAYVWAYKVDDRPALYPGVSIESMRLVPTTVTYANDLPTNPVLQKIVTTDQSIHWANPLNLDMMDSGRMQPYAGPPPVVAHLHGAEVSSRFDGGPDQWFTPDGRHGGGYETLRSTSGNAAVYRYVNTQEATTLWFHDHTLGATRLNVLRGLAAFYLLRDCYDTGRSGNPARLPAGPYEREIVIQDRQFDINGQLYFPDGGASGQGDVADLNGPPPNTKIHPYWNPEFFGDVMVVNGKSWPYLDVEPRRYRFRLLDGCNARFLKMTLRTTTLETAVARRKPDGTDDGPVFWVIGTDGGLLDKPAGVQTLFLAPGERADVIVDFSDYDGQTLTLLNDANAPYPDGTEADPDTNGQVMQFRVCLPLGDRDTTLDPAARGATLRTGLGLARPIVRLVDPKAGRLAVGVTAQVKRQLVLVEVAAETEAEPDIGGPVEVLVNNTKWNGLRNGTQSPIPGAKSDGHGNWISELPRVGSTEVWEIINLTGDAHPIHLHLVQYQLMNRQDFDVDGYRALYDSLFPGGVFPKLVLENNAFFKWVFPPDPQAEYGPGIYIPGFGPPRPWSIPNADGAIGGNPAIKHFLTGRAAPPRSEEAGWKDTVKMYPGQVTRVVVRFAPQSFPIGAVRPGRNLYAFDPAAGPGYVWHCHIVDHEDNEMMRPYRPVK